MTSTDGVEQIEIANDLNKFDTIGIDLVAMCKYFSRSRHVPICFRLYISQQIKFNKLKIIEELLKGVTV